MNQKKKIFPFLLRVLVIYYCVITPKLSGFTQHLVSQFLWAGNPGAASLGLPAQSPLRNRNKGIGQGCVISRLDWEWTCFQVRFYWQNSVPDGLLDWGPQFFVFCGPKATLSSLSHGPPHRAAQNMTAGFDQSEQGRGLERASEQHGSQSLLSPNFKVTSQ